MKINNFLIGLLLIGAACSTNSRETPKGHKYTLVKEGEGEAGKPGEFLLINMMIKDAKDSVWNDTRKQKLPMILPIREPQPGDEGIEEVFSVLKKGDSILFPIAAKTLFEKQGGRVPDNVDSTSIFTFYLGVKDILDEPAVRSLEQEIMGKLNSEQLAIDEALIDGYLAESNTEVQTTDSGLRYMFTRKGSGPTAAPGNEVSVNYAGYLLDGTLFDTSIESVAKANGAYTPGRPYEPLTLQAGSGQVIQGWEEAILLMNKGSKMRVWIPSTLAYGPRQRSEVIKPNSILVFDMEMMDIK
ncbi:MAG: FKBP-type peptidyl-prolyl cis-trans isomerase [Cyclobacteriaceae bacterium]|nr:FKBP-type peptidyl-prolyl cis-trans isomerase [Cyclobacteriaceae bacterium]MCB0498959.1 FKBP-type peptidyl-prolyl cis-trans isomerase [Cyclobacteriaceae bacterium]MCB9238235.1 FKBP-type peptidyl-prolyl cis-trans isomerase [Flammeovirgaceae bacterium]MCO5272160.1 FKBP-type peptidyl-prolyl cis-trans isomerase [Cyclobacteriaceae bacterium]MCW5902725.1 FKBP-type peptidyl-prolyl cis-trans isomerase [Cyclobacteriaceae bacterium]